jgi:hypothetical protein
MLALLYAVLEAGITQPLPGYPAVAIVGFVMIVLPGWLVAGALITRPETDLIERLAIGLAVGIALTAPAGLFALSLNVSLETFIRLHMLVSSAACAAAVFLAGSLYAFWPAGIRRDWRPAGVLLFGVALIAAGGILSSHSWADGRTARNFDDWRYMVYVNSYLHEDSLEPLSPADVGEEPYPRMLINVWAVTQAAIASSADVSAEAITLDHLTPLLIVASLAATYALAKGLFRRRDIALVATLVQLGFALTDLSRDEGIGINVLARITQDKFAATYILFPIALLYTTRFFVARTTNTFVLFLLTCAALFVVHPQPLLFLAVTVAAFAALRAFVRRSWRPAFDAALLGAPLAMFLLGELAVWHLFNTSWPAFFQAELTWRESFKIAHVPGGMIMGNYHLILHPLMLGALALTPFIWLRARKTIGGQFLLAGMLGWVPWFFLPPLTTLASKLASAELTARLPFTAPVAIVWAYVVVVALGWMGRSVRLPDVSLARWAFAPVALLAAAAVLAGGVAVLDLYHRVDKGAYFGWASEATVVPGTERSIFLGGKDRLFSGEWRIRPEDRAVLEYLSANVPDGSIVMAPENLSIRFPGIVWDVRPVFSRGILGQWQRPAATGLYAGYIEGAELEQALRDARIDYIVIKEDDEHANALRAVSAAGLVTNVGPYEIYVVEREFLRSQVRRVSSG